MPNCPSRSTGAYTTHGVQLPEVHPRTVRPTERSPRAQNPEAKSRGTRDNAVRLRHVESTRVPPRHAAPSPPQVLHSLHRLAKAQSRLPPDFLSGHAYQDGKWEHRGDFTQEADLVCGICGAHGGYRTVKVRDVRRIGEGRGLCGGARKIVDGVFPGRSQSLRHQHRPVDDCSPGRGGMAQNGGTRDGTFHGEMDRCGGSQDWTTACSRMPERDVKDQEEDSPKQAGSCWFARPCWLAISGANSYPPGVLFADVMKSFSGVTFVLFCFVFVLMRSLKPRPFVESSIGMQAPGRPHVFLSFLLLFIWRCRFFRDVSVPFPFSLCMESTPDVLSLQMVFSTLWSLAGIFTSACVRIQSINKKKTGNPEWDTFGAPLFFHAHYWYVPLVQCCLLFGIWRSDKPFFPTRGGAEGAIDL